MTAKLWKQILRVGLARVLVGSLVAAALVPFLSVEERGQSRIYFIRPILKVGGDRGRAVIEALRSDPVLGDEATALLKRLRK